MKWVLSCAQEAFRSAQELAVIMDWIQTVCQHIWLWFKDYLKASVSSINKYICRLFIKCKCRHCSINTAPFNKFTQHKCLIFLIFSSNPFSCGSECVKIFAHCKIANSSSPVACVKILQIDKLWPGWQVVLVLRGHFHQQNWTPFTHNSCGCGIKSEVFQNCKTIQRI